MATLCLKLASEASYDTVRSCLRIVASSPEPDADGEVVTPSTLRLDNYRRNPVVLWAHDQKTFPIAKCEDPAGNFTCYVDDLGRLIQDWYFADTTEARYVESLYRQGVLRGASVGFVPDGYKILSAEKAAQIFGVRKQLRIVTGGELRETSAVPVPSCPGALAFGWIDRAAVPEVMRRSPSGIITKSLRTYFPIVQARQRRESKLLEVMNAIKGCGDNIVSATATTTATTEVTPTPAPVTAAPAPVAETAEQLAAKAALLKKEMDSTSDANGGEEVSAGEKAKEVFKDLAHSYVDRMFESGEDEEHKACMTGIKMAHADHLKYKALEESDEDEGEGDGEGDGEGEEGEKSLAELVTKAMNDVIAPLVQKVNDLAKAVEDRPTAEEVMSAMSKLQAA